jgi:MFS family permease
MVGGILADMWSSKERNTPMVLFTGATLFGTGLGPLVSGVIAQRLLWRWVFYVQIISSGLIVGLVAAFFSETRGSTILEQKAKAINKWYDKLDALGVHLQDDRPASDTKHPYRRIRYTTNNPKPSVLKMIGHSLYRPMHMLVTEPVVMSFSAWISFAWAILYLQFGSVPLIFSTSYNFSLEQTGYVFTSQCVAAIISTVLHIRQEPFMLRYYPSKMTTPEGRLLPTCIMATFLPISLFWIGWTCFPWIHWILPTIAIGIATMGIFSIFLAVFNYTADAYGPYTSSALAASGVCRNLLGGAFPLVVHPLYLNLGFQAASSLLGAVAVVLTLVPVVLVWKGPRIRERSRIAKEFVGKEG